MKLAVLLVGLTLPFPALASPVRPADDLVLAKAREIEVRLGAQIGVVVYDMGDGRTWLYRADGRFPLTSTFKALACGALLHQVGAGQLIHHCHILETGNDSFRFRSSSADGRSKRTRTPA